MPKPSNVGKWKAFVNGAFLFGPPGNGQNLNDDLQAALGDELDAALAEIAGDGVTSGWVVAAGAGLSVTISSGSGYALGQRLASAAAATLANLPASTAGITIYASAVAPFQRANNGWTAGFGFTTGALAAGQVALAAVSTDGANVTGATDSRALISTVPSAAQKAALAGTSGAPGTGNKYVTDADARNANARTPVGHGATHGAKGSDPAPASGLSQSFRRLHLRTHPDVDKAASRVMLVHADEIVMDDGTSVAGWDNVSADITAAGAGGLDAGAEAASAWYEIHAIRKSSDGTKSLLLHRAKNFSVDQSNTAIADFGSGIKSAAENSYRALSFTPSVSGAVPFFDIPLQRNGTIAASGVYLEIRTDAAGRPSSTVLATSDKLDASVFPASGIGAAGQRFIFRVPPTLSAATTYWLVLRADYVVNSLNFLGIGVSRPATGGNAWASPDGVTWTQNVGSSIVFKQYRTDNDAAVALPAGYNQKALVGWVYNDAGSDFVKFAAKDRLVEFMPTRFFGQVSVAAQTLSDLSSMLPPVPVDFRFQSSISLAREVFYIGSTPNGHGLVALGGVSTVPSAGKLILSPTADSNPNSAGNIVTELQSSYLSVSAGIGNLYPTGFVW